MDLIYQILVLVVIFVAFCIFFFSEGNKKRLHEKFQRTVIKVQVNGEEVCMKKSGFLVKEWTRVYPPVTEDGTKWIVKNAIFGSKKNFVTATLITIIAIFAIVGFYEYTNSLTDFLQQPEIKSCIEKLGYEIK